MKDTDMPALPLTGGCQCGQLRYQITSRPLTLYCCHCSECQAQSSSAFGMSLRVLEGGVKTKGKHASFYRDAGGPLAVECVYCPECGSRVVHRGRGADSGASIKAGTLDDRAWLRPVGHIWTASAQKWLTLEGLVYEHQPTDTYAALIHAFQKQQG